MEQKSKKLKKVIIVLVILLIISASALAGTLIYNHYAHTEPATVNVPGNIITPNGSDSSDIKTDPPPSESVSTSNGETTSAPDTSKAPDRSEAETTSVSSTKASAISLHNQKPEDNRPFQAANLFPGDAETKYYCIQVSHQGDIVVRFHAGVRPGYEKLAEVLRCRVALLTTGETLYDGLMRDMPKSLDHSLDTSTSTKSELYYEITAYLDTGVGNDYMDKTLIADFRWWVEDEEHLDPPKTGDPTYIYLWAGLAAASLLILLSLVGKRRKEERNHG